MQLLPESVTSVSTAALDATWATRMELLRFEQLKVDILNETNSVKLEMWLEMFGVSLAAIPDDLTTEEYQALLRQVITIFRLCGTKRSIELLCLILGATEVEIVQNYSTYYNGSIAYNGLYYYDGGAAHRPFVVWLRVTGISNSGFEVFAGKLRKLFEIFEPIWIYLEGMEIAGDGFPMTFPFILAGTEGFPMTFPFVLGEASRFPVVFV
jgi:hypothetical protein